MFSASSRMAGNVDDDVIGLRGFRLICGALILHLRPEAFASRL
jgi:hypothetical protein